MKYRKTALIEAEQFNEAEWQKKYKACQHPDEWDRIADRLGIDHYLNHFVIRTLEGEMLVHDGDWIATGVNGEHWAIADDVFKKTYAKLPVIPDYAAAFIEWCKDHKKGIGYATCPTFFQNFVLEKHATSEWKHIWITDEQNGETFANAWVNGYEVEK